MTIYTIYLATNVVNGKRYVGFDSNWPKRRASHIHNALSGSLNTHRYYFHHAIAKYGKDNFRWEVLYQSLDGEHTKHVMEQHFIHEYRTYKGFPDSCGYNLTLGGDGAFGRLREIGKPTKRSRGITTPLGNHDSVTQAARRHNMTIGNVRRRLHSPFWNEWCFTGTSKVTKDREFRTSSKSRQIVTPLGTFPSVGIAVKQTKLSSCTIRKRLDSVWQLDWYYADTPKVAVEYITQKSRGVTTPMGNFNSLAIASKRTGLHKSTILRRLDSPNFPDWCYTIPNQ
jgi:hypothetical protein